MITKKTLMLARRCAREYYDSDPLRRYHTWKRILYMEKQALRLWHLSPEEYLALWFHNVIHTPAAHKGNKTASAEVLRKECGFLGIDPLMVEEGVYLIERFSSSQIDSSHKIKRLHDLAYVIFGDKRPAYIRRQSSIVAEEYVPVIGMAAWYGKRVEFLQSLLDRETIFLTNECRSRFERQARLNIHAEILKIRNNDDGISPA